MAKPKIIFITGTDTGVGKTLLTTLFLQHLRQREVRALAMKPFCSGNRDDVRMLQSAQKGELTDDEVNPFYFKEAIAPLVAAAKIRRRISLADVLKKIRCVEQKCDCLLIEGSGGLLVPLGKNYTVADIIAALRCNVIVVARNRLGTINHTLLTMRVLREIGIKEKQMAVILMGQGKKDLSSRTNKPILAKLLGKIPVLSMPFLGRKPSHGQVRVINLREERSLEQLLRHLSRRLA